MSDRSDDLVVFDKELDSVVEEIVSAYKRRFIDTEYCMFPKEFFSVLKKINDEYSEKYTNGNETERKSIVCQVLKQYNARVLNACVKFVNELRSPKEETKETTQNEQQNNVDAE